MRRECFSQIGSRKTDSDIYGANSWVSVREFGGSRREHPVSGHEFPVSGYKLGVPRVCFHILRRKLGAGRSLMFCGVKKSFLYACGTMRHECFSQIGSRKINSDIHGANSWVQRVNIRFQCANSWVSVREFGGSVRELGVSVREHPGRGINSGFRGCACVFYGVSSGQVDRLCFAE